jgi:hypothetical protein
VRAGTARRGLEGIPSMLNPEFRLSRVLIVAAMVAISGCSGVRGDGSATSLPAGVAAATRSSLPKPGTFFGTVFAGSLPGSVVFAAPPFAKFGSTGPLQGPVNMALTKKDALIIASAPTPIASSGPLSIIQPPYTGAPATIAKVFWAGGMVLDQNDDVILAQGTKARSNRTYFKEYLAPDYTKSVRFGEVTGRYIGSMVALPNGAFAVGSVRNGPHDTSLPGNLAIYRPPYTQPPTILAGLPFVTAMTVVPAGLIVAVCPQCYSSKAGGSYLALVAPAFKSVTKVLVRLGNVAAEGITSNAAGDIFVKQAGTQGSFLYRYASPYSKGFELANTTGALESMTTAPNGDLFFGALGAGHFVIDRLPAPYTGQPQTIYTPFGPPGQMTVAK